MALLPSVVESCVPREEVLRGGLVDKHFAAQLDQVIRDAAGYHDYADPDSFFKITHPTNGLRDLLAGTFARLSGNASATPSAEHAVYRYETSFGGGENARSHRPLASGQWCPSSKHQRIHRSGSAA